MKRVWYFMPVLVVLVSVPTGANVIFSDDFEGDFGNWSATYEPVPSGSTQLLAADTEHAFGRQAAKQRVSTGQSTWDYMETRQNAFSGPGIVQPGYAEIARVMFYDPGTTSTLYGGGLMLAAPKYDGSTDLWDLYQIGVYGLAVSSNPWRANYYGWRASAEGPTSYYNTRIERTAGWHDFRIVVGAYTGAVGDVKFYIDNVLAGEARRMGDYELKQIRLGISYRTGVPFWYDNVGLEMVAIPAPGAMVLVLVGVGMLGWAKRRVA